METCDSQSGLCTLSHTGTKENSFDITQPVLFYVGDPMCSWCWGISQELVKVQKYCTTHNIKFKVVLGGLRIGGGDKWNDQFKGFLKNEWTNISKKTGQKFTFELLNLEEFNYDTLPACLAVFIVRKHFNENDDNSLLVLEFFSKIQEKFYTKGEDPTKLEFYKDICDQFNINFKQFKKFFNSKETAIELQDDFSLSAKLKVRGMPSLVYAKENKVVDISSGYNSYENILKMIEN